MVNVDGSFAVLAIRFLKIETAAFAHSTVMANTGLTSPGVALAGINRDPLLAPSM